MRTMSGFRTFVMVVAMAAIAACASNPVGEAETFEQRAYALYGTYVIFQGKAAELKQDSATPDKVKQALSAADAVAYPLAESLVDAAITVGDIRDTLNACPTLPEPNPDCVPTNEQKLANAILNLSSIYFKAKPALLGVVAAVKGAK